MNTASDEQALNVETASVADGVTRPVDPRWVAYGRRVGWVWAFIFALIVAVAVAMALLAELPTIPVVITGVIIAIAQTCLLQWWPSVTYRYISYRLSGRALEIQRGVLWRQVIDVPRSRIQHTDVSQGPFERRYGLASLTVFTAGTTYSAVRLAGLEHGRALAIREYLMQADDDDVV